MATHRAKIGEGGRLVIPAECRKELGINVGDDVIVHAEDQELRIYTLREAARRAQAIVRQYVPEGYSLVDELIAERRAEAERE